MRAWACWGRLESTVVLFQFGVCAAKLLRGSQQHDTNQCVDVNAARHYPSASILNCRLLAGLISFSLFFFLFFIFYF